MPQKKTLKPTFIVALDPFAATFCAEVRRRLGRQLGASFNGRNTLIQACSLVDDGHALKFELDIDAYLNSTPEYRNFDLARARALVDTANSSKAVRLHIWEDQAADGLSEILLGARSLIDIEAAHHAGFDVSDARVIYLVLTSSHPVAVNAVLELARVIHFLFATRFKDSLYTLHALVLLPELFTNHGTADYVTTYNLLKRLDHAFANGLGVLAHQRTRPFEECWLLDGHNQRVVGTGTLAENLAGYADAFVGLLSAGPEDSMAAPGMNSRGKPPAYNSFGYGELYLPSDVAVTRLGATLAYDITRRFFLGDAETANHDDRRLLNDVKVFVKSEAFTNTLEQVRRHCDGHNIWQPPALRERLREDSPGEYIEVLRRHYDAFDQGPMAKYRSALSESRERVLVELTRQLDDEIDARADASLTGLKDAVEYLRLMVDPAIELQQPSGEDPRNLRTLLREAEAMLDGEMSVTPRQEDSAALLEEILDLCNSLSELRTDLRLLPESENQPDTTPDNPQQRLTTMIEETEERVRNLSDDYRRTVEVEDQTTDALRIEAVKTVTAEKLQQIENYERALLPLSEQLRQVRRDYQDRLEDRRQFMHRYLVALPGLFALIVLSILLLGWVAGIWPVAELVTLIPIYLPGFIFVVLIIALFYFVGVFGVFFRGLRIRIAEAETRVTQLNSKLQFTATQLLNARNAYQLFKFELYALRMRREAVSHLIKTAQTRIRSLTDRLDALRASAASFARERDESLPLASPMRRPLIVAADIDA